MSNAYLAEATQEYLDDEDLKDVQTYGVIRRIKLADNDSDEYLFDTEMRMVDIWEGCDRIPCENGK